MPGPHSVNEGASLHCFLLRRIPFPKLGSNSCRISHLEVELGVQACIPRSVDALISLSSFYTSYVLQLSCQEWKH